MRIQLKHILIPFILFSASMLTLADSDHDKAKMLREKGNILPLEDILANARKIQSGRILEIELEHKNQRVIYEIELLTPNGVVLELLFDARTGKHLSTHKEN